jgi:hypothetical protein
MESSKEVRRVLNRNGVDLSYCQYSVAGHEISLTGWLCKTDGSDFIAGQVEGMTISKDHSTVFISPGISITGALHRNTFHSLVTGTENSTVVPEKNRYGKLISTITISRPAERSHPYVSV